MVELRGRSEAMRGRDVQVREAAAGGLVLVLALALALVVGAQTVVLVRGAFEVRADGADAFGLSNKPGRRCVSFTPTPAPNARGRKGVMSMREWNYERTGGADTRLGRARLTSSEYISPKSMSGAVFGGRTKPSLTWTFPVACVELRVETRFFEMSWGVPYSQLTHGHAHERAMRNGARCCSCRQRRTPGRLGTSRPEVSTPLLGSPS